MTEDNIIKARIMEVIKDLQNRYNCKIYLDEDDIELLSDESFYEQIFEIINKHRCE